MTITLEERVTQLESQLRRAHRLLVMGGVFAAIALGVACKSPPSESLHMGNVTVDSSGIHIGDARGRVNLGREGLTISRIENDRIVATTTVHDGQLELKKDGGGSVNLYLDPLDPSAKPSLMLDSNKAGGLLFTARPGDASIIAHAGKTLGSLSAIDTADEPSCHEGAMCKGTATLYLDNGRGQLEKLSVPRPAK